MGFVLKLTGILSLIIGLQVTQLTIASAAIDPHSSKKQLYRYNLDYNPPHRGGPSRSQGSGSR